MRNWFGYKYDWVIPIKDKKGVSIVNAFKSIISKKESQIDTDWAR